MWEKQDSLTYFQISTFPENQVKMHASKLTDTSYIFTFRGYSKVMWLILCAAHSIVMTFLCSSTPRKSRQAPEKELKNRIFNKSKLF